MCCGVTEWHCTVICCVFCLLITLKVSLLALALLRVWAGIFIAFFPLLRCISFTPCDYVCLVRPVFIYVYDSAFIDHELILLFYHLIIQNCEIFPYFFTGRFRFDCHKGWFLLIHSKFCEFDNQSSWKRKRFPYKKTKGTDPKPQDP